MAEPTNDTPADDTPVELDAFTAELADQGFAIIDGYPANHRLRAEALSKAGKAEDPAGHISPELIAETGDRLAAEAAEAEAAERAAPSDRWTVRDLRAEAERRGIAVETDANKATVLAAINAAPAAA